MKHNSNSCCVNNNTLNSVLQASYHPEVVCLQEVHRHSLSCYCDMLSKEYHLCKVDYQSTRGHEAMGAECDKYLLIGLNKDLFNEPPSDFLGLQVETHYARFGIVIEATTKFKESLQIANVHLKQGKHFAQARSLQIDHLLRRLRDTNHRYVVAGDWNYSFWSENGRRLQLPESMKRNSLSCLVPAPDGSDDVHWVYAPFEWTKATEICRCRPLSDFHGYLWAKLYIPTP